MAFILNLIAIQTYALDYPHNGIIGCDSCHYIYGTESTLMLPWLVYGVEGIDDTQYNSLCWSCHNNIIAPDMETHSSLQIDNDYGNWTVECKGGGWYYSVARGGIISFDRPAAYQPPKQGNGFSYEFDGDVVPDYATFCLDCHSNRVSAANPPVNWGQGVACTGNTVNPPDQRIACNAPHGLGSANRPYNWGDVALYGASGNPDPIFSESGVTRGRGGGHFMRWPYDSAFRNAGVNFVMSCTDCHEAHGSDRSSMIRERFNVNANGDCGTGGTAAADGENCSDGGNWNSFCNACHYYYGGQHAGMSCGNASCHETNSIHRIIKNGEYSGATNLWTEPSRPTYTSEIASVEGVAGYSDLTVTFSEGVYTNMDQTGAIVISVILRRIYSPLITQ